MIGHLQVVQNSRNQGLKEQQKAARLKHHHLGQRYHTPEAPHEGDQLQTPVRLRILMPRDGGNVPSPISTPTTSKAPKPQSNGGGGAVSKQDGEMEKPSTLPSKSRSLKQA